MRKLLCLLATLFICTSLFADGKLFLDSDNIHTYQGKPGKWIFINDSKQLKHYIRKHGTSLSAVKRINNTTTVNQHLFIPYSQARIEGIMSEEPRTHITSQERNFFWPLGKPVNITSNFGIRRGKLHAGVDFSIGKGAPIYAAMDGRVVYVGFAGGYGKSIIIEHRNGFKTRYSHNSANLVKKGDLVRKGQIIALVGSTGRSTGSHLDFEIRMRNIPLNPLDFMPEAKNLKINHDYTPLLKKIRSPKQLRYYH